MLNKSKKPAAKSSKLPIVRRADAMAKAKQEVPAAKAKVPAKTKTVAKPSAPANAVATERTATKKAAHVATAPPPVAWDTAEPQAAAPAALTRDTAAPPSEITAPPADAPEKTKPKSAPPIAKLPRPPGQLSCLDAAVEVLKGSGVPMQCKTMIDAMSRAKLWTSEAPTPAATLSSALLREIKVKGTASRFKKADRGHFTLNA